MKNALLTVLVVAGAITLSVVAAQAPGKPALKVRARPLAKPSPKPANRPAGRAGAIATARSASAVAARAADPIASRPPAVSPALSVAAHVARTNPRASSGPFEVGTNVFNLDLDLDLGNRYGAGLFRGNSSVSPTLSLSYERELLPLRPGVLGAGVFAGYQRRKTTSAATSGSMPTSS